MVRAFLLPCPLTWLKRRGRPLQDGAEVVRQQLLAVVLKTAHSFCPRFGRESGFAASKDPHTLSLLRQGAAGDLDHTKGVTTQLCQAFHVVIKRGLPLLLLVLWLLSTILGDRRLLARAPSGNRTKQ